MPLLQELKTARSDLRLVQIQIIARPFIWYGVSYFGFIVSLINSLLSGKVCESIMVLSPLFLFLFVSINNPFSFGFVFLCQLIVLSFSFFVLLCSSKW